jgi:hypothetical protein
MGATVMENEGHKSPTTLLILFEVISLAVLALFFWLRRGNKLLFWGLIAVIAMIAMIAAI